ncbi:MAG: excinuclease ABC subunit A, partial [Patescibacteria group bacterium]
MQNTDNIVIRGARMHNLKGINVSIPRNRLTVITGLSGSGKSSLAFDTIYAEGQRRYVESLSAYARQFIAQMEKPEVESIEGLSPAISIDQKTAPRNPRSTVGTVTEIYDYMRLLWAKAGKVHCSVCGRELSKQSASQIVETVARMPEGRKIYLLAPVVEGRKGEHVKIVDSIRREGFVRMRIDGGIVTVDEDIKLDPKKAHTIQIVVDRLVVRDLAPTPIPSPPSTSSHAASSGQAGQAGGGGNGGTGINPNRTRLADSVELCLKKGEGSLIVLDADTDKETRFAESFVCPDHPEEDIPEIEPRSFSFNSPHGACEECHGLGSILQVDENVVVPNPRLSLAEGAIHPWATSASRSGFTGQLLEALAGEVGFGMDTPWEDLAPEHRKIILWGHDRQLRLSFNTAKFGGTYQTTYEGVIPNLRRRHSETDSSYIRMQIEE